MKKIIKLLAIGFLILASIASFAQTISAGLWHGLAICGKGQIMTWGNNSAGQLGIGTNSDSNVPVQVIGLSGIIAITTGDQHSMALKNDGTVWIWGRNDEGQLGNGTEGGSINFPVQATGLCQVISGIERRNINSTINISPNPTSKELIIKNAELRIKEIEIYSSLGEKLFSEHPVTSNQQQLTISVADFIPGIYFITVTDHAGNKVTRKVVKM